MGRDGTNDGVSGQGLKELVILASFLVVYLLLLWGIDRMSPPAVRDWLVLLLPNLWLLVTSLLLARRAGSKLARLRGGRRVWLGSLVAAVMATILVAMALLWPDAEGSASGRSITIVLQGGLLVVLVPFAEEIYFRGVLLDSLRQTTGSLLAVILVSVLFAFLHAPQGTAIPMAVLSTCAGLLAIASESMLWAVVVHVGWNSLAVVRFTPSGFERWIIVGASLALLIGLLFWGLKTRDGQEIEA